MTNKALGVKRRVIGAKKGISASFRGIVGVFVACILLITDSSICQADEIDDLIPYIIEVESHGNPTAISLAGAIGLMQITPIVLKEFQETEFPAGNIWDLFNAEKNVFLGTWYLRRLKDHYLKDHYTIERMLAAYNGGITRLRKVNYDINKMPHETREYVKKVMKLYQRSI